MKFNKYNNPSRKNRRYYKHSKGYTQEKKTELYEALSKCETEEQKNMLIKAYNISMN